jgi:hypothetical protein
VRKGGIRRIPDKRELKSWKNMDSRLRGSDEWQQTDDEDDKKGEIMKIEKMFSCALVFVLALFLAMPTGASGQDAAKKVFSQEELEQMLAPIALYPDSLLTQVLMASTYPIEIVQADRFAKKNKDLKGDKLLEAAKNEDWDPTVKSLLQFPEVVGMMSEKLDWTTKLGDAFLAQQKDVLDSV